MLRSIFSTIPLRSPIRFLLQPKPISLSFLLCTRYCRPLAKLVALHGASVYFLHWGHQMTVYSWCRYSPHSWFIPPGHTANSCSTCPPPRLPGPFLPSEAVCPSLSCGVRLFHSRRRTLHVTSVEFVMFLFFLSCCFPQYFHRNSTARCLLHKQISRTE